MSTTSLTLREDLARQHIARMCDGARTLLLSGAKHADRAGLDELEVDLLGHVAAVDRTREEAEA